MNSLRQYLKKYSEIDPDIVLVYRPTEDSRWSDRCLYGGEGYDVHKPYNHRTMLLNEVVIEFDDPDKEKNKEYADEVARRLRADKIAFTKWFSGNKSVHIHCLLDIDGAQNRTLLKKVFMRHYCEGLPMPDLQLTSDRHLIRAEFGIHEKTGKYKEYISRSGDIGKVSEIPLVVWDKYRKEYETSLRREMTRNADKNFKDHPAFKIMQETQHLNDGRSNGLFILIHVLKAEYTKEELIDYLQRWYKYSGGTKLSPGQIAWQVNYQWNRNYNVKKLLDDYYFQYGQ